MMDQRVVHLGQRACISVHKAVLGSDAPCFQCTPPVEIGVSSIAAALLQSISCPSSTACCATADKFISHDTSALLCSFRRCSRVACLDDVHLGAGSAGDPVDYSCPVLGLNAIPQVHKHPSEGLVEAEAGTNAQGGDQSPQ